MSHVLADPASVEWFKFHAIGATMPNLNEGIIRSFPFALPPLPEQRAIAHILGTLDDKIELNRRMNETLEAIARALFKSWFVDFDPVRAKAAGRKPTGMDAAIADLFPDEFQDSELGEIPKGWRVGRLDDLLLLQRGFDLPTPKRVPGPFSVVAASGPSSGHATAKVRGPGVVTGRSGVLGRVFLVLDDFWPLNTTLWVKEFRACGPCYAYFTLQQVDLSGLNAGPAVPPLNRNHVHGLPCLVPPPAVIGAFERPSLAFFRKRDATVGESEDVAAIRDALLPRLLSGELPVAGIEREMQEGK